METDDNEAAPSAARVADRQAITELIYRYCRAVDRMDVPLGHSIWHEDAEADYGPDVYQGPGRGVIDAICLLHRQLTAHSHQVTNITIALDGDSAASEAYATVVTRMERDGAHVEMMMWVRYLDRWSRRGGRWGIDRRLAIVDCDSVREVVPLGTAGRGRRDRDDPSYAFLALR